MKRVLWLGMCWLLYFTVFGYFDLMSMVLPITVNTVDTVVKQVPVSLQ